MVYELWVVSVPGNSLGTGLQSYGNNRSLLLDGNAFNLREFKKNHEEIIFTFIYLESTTTSISCRQKRLAQRPNLTYNQMIPLFCICPCADMILSARLLVDAIMV
jgi:hypothetical protein